MSITRKSIGSIAVIALLLGMTVGTAAQTSTDTVGVYTDLNDSMCSVDLDLGGAYNRFGSWEWDGTSWVETSGKNSVQAIVTFLTTAHAGCDLIVTFPGLDNGAGGVIPGNLFDGRLDATNEPLTPATWSLTAIACCSFTFHYWLDTVPETLDPGRYDGTITITVSNAL